MLNLDLGFLNSAELKRTIQVLYDIHVHADGNSSHTANTNPPASSDFSGNPPTKPSILNPKASAFESKYDTSITIPQPLTDFPDNSSTGTPQALPPLRIDMTHGEILQWALKASSNISNSLRPNCPPPRHIRHPSHLKLIPARVTPSGTSKPKSMAPEVVIKKGVDENNLLGIIRSDDQDQQRSRTDSAICLHTQANNFKDQETADEINSTQNHAAVPQTVAVPREVHRPFLPSTMLQMQMGLCPPYAVRQCSRTYPDPKYQGDIQSKSFAKQNPNLSTDENCALYITGIPANIFPHEIFDMITEGAVFCLHMNPPTDRYLTQAAKLVFMAPEAAAKWFARGKSLEGVVIGGQRVVVKYNRHGYVRNNAPRSRVIQVEGPEGIMNIENWNTFFRSYCVLEWDRVMFRSCPKLGRKIMEFRFVRIDGQAQTCLQAIFNEPKLKNFINAFYIPDPCAASPMKL